MAVLFNDHRQRFYCSTIYESNRAILHIPDAWLPHIHLFVHNHPNDNTNFSFDDLVVIQSYGCPNALLVCQNLSFLLEGLPRDWSAEAPEKLKTPEALTNFLHDKTSSAWLPHDPFRAYDDAVENMIMQLNHSDIKAKYTVFDDTGKTLKITPGAYTVDQMLQYHDLIHYLRYIKPLAHLIQS